MIGLAAITFVAMLALVDLLILKTIQIVCEYLSVSDRVTNILYIIGPAVLAIILAGIIAYYADGAVVI